MKVRELTEEQFEEFLKKCKNSSMYQSTEYALTMNNQDYKTIYYGLESDEEIKAATLILIEKIHGFKYALAPRGYLIDYEDKNLLTDFTKLLRKKLSKKHIIAIKINPLIIRSKYNPKMKDIKEESEYKDIFENLKSLNYFHLGYNNYFEGLKPRFESIININKPINELFKAVSKQFKNKIKKANFEGIKIYKGSKDDLEYIYNQAKEKYNRDISYYQDAYHYFEKSKKIDLYYAKMDTKAYLQSVQIMYQKQVEKCNKANSEVFKNRENQNNKAINKKLYEENILNTLKNELVYATNLLREKPEGIVLASALIVKHQKTAYLFMDGYSTEYKKFSAKHLLIWKLIEKYSLEKFRKFNMGGIASFYLKSNENKFKGLNEFRLGFGATGYEYTGDFELVTNKFFYFLYQTLSPILKKIKKKKKNTSRRNDDTDADVETKEKKPSLLSLLLNRKKNDE